MIFKTRSNFFVAALAAFSILPFSAQSEAIRFDEPLVDLNEFKAIEIIESKGLTYDIRRVPDCGFPGDVTETIPEIRAGTSVPNGEEITLLITTKTGKASVPVVSDLTLQEATEKLHDECFKVIPTLTTPSDIVYGRCGEGRKVFVPNTGFIDRVVSTLPEEGKEADWTSEVRVNRFRDGVYKVTNPPTPDNGKECN